MCVEHAPGFFGFRIGSLLAEGQKVVFRMARQSIKILRNLGKRKRKWPPPKQKPVNNCLQLKS